MRTARTDQQQSTHREEGDEYVIETKENWNYRAPSNLHPGGEALTPSELRPCYRSGK